MELVRIFSTRPVNFKIYAGWPAGRPADQPVSDQSGWPGFSQKVFVYSSMHLLKNFKKGRGHGSEMETGRVEILRPAGQADWNTGRILFSGN